MIITLISTGLGLMVAIPISNIEVSKKRKIIYWLVRVVGFFLVTAVMISWAESLGRDAVGAPGGSGLMFAFGLGLMAWWRARGRPEEDLHESEPAAETRECPFCAERIMLKAIVCKHCGRDLETPG